MAKNDIGGVWRTVGGRRIFIKDGQDLSSAMKESGKFKTGSKKKVDKNDLNALNKIADNNEDINNYEGLDDIAKDYIKNRRKEIGQKEFTDKANEIHEKTKEKAIESEKTTDSDKRYNTQSSMKKLESETKQAQMEYEHAKDKYEHHKFDDNESESKQASRKAYEDAKDRLVKAQRKEDEYRASKTIEENKSKYSAEYESYKEKHPNTDLTLNDYIKVKQGGVGGTPIKTSESPKTNNGSNDWVRNAFNEYKKEHPNTKMTLEQFKKSKK